MAPRKRQAPVEADISTPPTLTTAIVLAPPMPVVAEEPPDPASIVPAFALTLAKLESAGLELAQYEAVVFAADFAITNEAQLEWANKVAHRSKDIERDWEAERKRQVGPFNALVKKVNGAFNPVVDRAERLKKAAGAGAAAYMDRKDAERRKALSAAAQAYQSGDAAAAQQALAVVNNLQAGDPDGLTVTKKWVATIVAPELVPREFCVPDETKINAAARAASETQPPPVIPGVTFTLQNFTAVR